MSDDKRRVLAERVREACARAIELKRWHPGGIHGAINPASAASEVRAVDIKAILERELGTNEGLD